MIGVARRNGAAGEAVEAAARTAGAAARVGWGGRLEGGGRGRGGGGRGRPTRGGGGGGRGRPTTAAFLPTALPAPIPGWAHDLPDVRCGRPRPQGAHPPAPRRRR